MGRWAQYRHRGRGASGFPFAPPVPAEWIWTYDETEEDLIAVADSPGPTPTHYTVRYRLEPSPAWLNGGFTSAGSELSIPITPAPGQDWEGQAAWADASGNQVSDWSSTKHALVL